MPNKQKPLPSVEESLRKIAASQAETEASIARGEASLAQAKASLADAHATIARIERAREADRKELAEWKADREAEREADRAKREAEREADRIALAKWKAEHDKAMAGHRKFMKEWDKKMAEIRRDWGSFSGSEGEILEDNVVHAVSEAKEICGIVLDDVKPNLRKRATGLQYDALGVNGKTAVLMEVKRTLGVDDVRDFLDKQMATVGKDYPQHTKGKQLIGAMICQNFRSDKAVAAALSAGLLLLRAEGDKRLRQIKSVRGARRAQQTK